MIAIKTFKGKVIEPFEFVFAADIIGVGEDVTVGVRVGFVTGEVVGFGVKVEDSPIVTVWVLLQPLD